MEMNDETQTGSNKYTVMGGVGDLEKQACFC